MFCGTFGGLCFPSTFLKNFKPLAIFSACTARCVSDLFGNIEDSFSHDAALMAVIRTGFLVLNVSWD